MRGEKRGWSRAGRDLSLRAQRVEYAILRQLWQRDHVVNGLAAGARRGAVAVDGRLGAAPQRDVRVQLQARPLLTRHRESCGVGCGRPRARAAALGAKALFAPPEETKSWQDLFTQIRKCRCNRIYGATCSLATCRERRRPIHTVRSHRPQSYARSGDVRRTDGRRPRARSGSRTPR